MPKPPLILSALAHDIHAAAACWTLQRNGIAATWALTLVDDVIDPPFSLHCDAHEGVRATGGPGDGVGSVWFRRPRHPDHFPHALDADLPFLRNEWMRYMRNLYALSDALTDSFWINRPPAAVDAENKLVQLRAAHRCGIGFPQTLVSSDAAQIRRFVASHGRVVYKPFQTHTWQTGDSGRMYSTYARIVDADMLDDASLRQCPGIYHALVDKRHDLRVTIIGDRCFAAKLESANDDTFVDWRVSSLGGAMRAKAASLPGGYAQKLARLMRELDLVFGCVDLAIDAAGDAHFLEINQAGQFLFIEEAVPDLPLLRAMCAMLAQGRGDYSIDAMTGVSYAEYLASDEYAAWWARVSPGIKGADGQIPGVSIE